MINLIINTLATYAIAVVVTQEHGPMAIFSRLRTWLETKRPTAPIPPNTNATAEQWQTYQLNYSLFNDDDERFYSTLWGYAYALASCPVCLGAYAAALVVIWQGGGLLDWLAAYGGHLVLLKVIKE